VTGNYPRAEALYREALAVYGTVEGPRHLHTATAHHLLGQFYLAAGRHAVAEQHVCKARSIQDSALPADHADRASNALLLGQLLAARGDLASAEAEFQFALRLRTAAFPSQSEPVAEAQGFLGETWLKLGRTEEAHALLTASHEAYLALHGEQDRQTRQAAARLASL
jgi:tetratricopeptide (TPR) repeat protein